VPYSKFVSFFFEYLSHSDNEATPILEDFFVDKSVCKLVVVTMTNFGRMISFFGPLVVPYVAGGIIQKIKDLYNNSWFFGHMVTSEAQKCLRNCRPGTFLLRFSNTRDDCFVITSVRQGISSGANQMINTRVKFKLKHRQYCLLDGQSFGSLQDLVAHGENLELKEPWNGISEYRRGIHASVEDSNPYFVTSALKEFDVSSLNEKFYEINKLISQYREKENFDLEPYYRKISAWLDFLNEQRGIITQALARPKQLEPAYFAKLKEAESELWSNITVLEYFLNPTLFAQEQ